MYARTWVVLAVVAVTLSVGVLFSAVLGPRLQEAGLLVASEAGRIKGTIAVAGDNYLGYWFLTSREFGKRLRERGYAIRWTNDGGNYAERNEKFARGQYDLMVLPVNSYLFHGFPHKYPGVIAAALSDSKGADAVVGYSDRLAEGAERPPVVNDLNNPRLKICLTPDSPSQFLLNVAIVHFALDDLKRGGPWNQATRGSEEAFGRLRSRQCDAAVLWEPDVSRALGLPGVVPIFGSDQLSGMIIDVFVARRQWIRDSAEAADAFFTAYFETLVYYRGGREELLAELAKDPVLGSSEAADRAMSRVSWFGLEPNCQEWFNVGLPGVQSPGRGERIADTIAQVTDVMIRVGELAADPLGGNPYTITHVDVLRRVCGQWIGSTAVGAGGLSSFLPLAEDQWLRLRAIGRMRAVAVSFDPGRATLTREGAAAVDQAATALTNNYPQYRVFVRGHTAPSGDEEANVVLSRERADAVRSYLAAAHGVDPNRLASVGVGSGEPLPRQLGEGELSYRNRLARVEFVLLEGAP